MSRSSLVFLFLCLAGSATAQEVTIYRCEDAKGRLTLRDSPCAPGETQQTRAMQRPRDPAPPAKPDTPVTNSPAPKPSAEPPARVVYLAPPRPMYECVTGEGERYTSDTGEGTVRWVPYDGIGYAVVPDPVRPPVRPPDNRPPPSDRTRPSAWVVPVGEWVRDECHALPQADTCARLSDRRYEILRRYGSAMPSERSALDREQRAIDARMANDCRNL